MRFRISAGVLTIAVALMWLTANTTADQQAAGATGKPAAAARPAASTAKPYKAPRTPDGQPDLGGFWSNATYTPLERAQNVTKEYYTEEEFKKLLTDRRENDEEQTTPGTTADVHYDFTQFALDNHQSTLSRSLRTSLIFDPPDGKMPPMTAEGQKRNADRAAARKAMGPATDAVQNMSNGARCIIMGGSGPPLMDAGYNANYHIVQTRDHVMILTEMNHDARIIPLNRVAKAPAGVRPWIGVSAGRWDGDTLVVETTNFNGRNPFRGSSENLKVIERFTRIADDAIVYRFTIEDPSTWSRPWSAEERLQKTDGPIFEHACHEGNYGITNTLAGARAEERAAEEAAASKAGTR